MKLGGKPEEPRETNPEHVFNQEGKSLRILPQGLLLDNGTAPMIGSQNFFIISNQVFMANPKIEQFQKVLKMDPKDETMWFGLGKAYMGDEQWDEAIAALEQCLTVKPTYSAALFALAQSLNRNGDQDRCRTVCDEGIKVATANGDLLVIKQLEELKNSLPS